MLLQYYYVDTKLAFVIVTRGLLRIPQMVVLTTVLSHLRFFHGKIGFLSPEKASCDRDTLSNPRCLLGVLGFGLDIVGSFTCLSIATLQQAIFVGLFTCRTFVGLATHRTVAIPSL